MYFKNFKILSVCSILISLIFLSKVNAQTSELPPDFNITLNVIYLKDSRLPTISENDIKEILQEAKDELNIKLGVNYINFKYMGIQPINIFFSKFLNKNSSYYKELNQSRYNLFSGSIPYNSNREKIKEFLKQWKLWDLKNFFPQEIQARINNYDDVIDELFKVYLEKLKILENLKSKEGYFLIDRKNNEYNSYINWLVATFFQDIYDIIITNTIIVYDDFLHPYPHAVLRYAKVGGSSFDSPKREPFFGRSAMVNLFEMLTDIDYFKERYKNKSIDKSLWNKIIGSFILAHEIGHALFLIPDVYDHPKQCLMNSAYETMDYFEGYKLLKDYPYICPKCEVYVKARENYFLGELEFKNKNYENAIHYYRLCAKMTPEKLDVDYNQYISSIYFKIGNIYYLLNQNNDAKFYLDKALKSNPENKEAENLFKKISE